jgi:hypothetical protein
MQAQIL